MYHHLHQEDEPVANAINVDQFEEEMSFLKEEGYTAVSFQELIDYVDLQMADTTSSWHMQPDGTYVRHSKDAEGKPLLDCQEYLIKKHMRKKATN